MNLGDSEVILRPFRLYYRNNRVLMLRYLIKHCLSSNRWFLLVAATSPKSDIKVFMSLAYPTSFLSIWVDKL